MPKRPISYRFRIREGKGKILEMVTTFVYHDGSMGEVAKINERGETDYNGLLYNMFGYFGDTDKYYTNGKWEGFTKERRAWRKPCFFAPVPITKGETKLILEKYPGFKYTLQKMNGKWKSKSFIFFVLCSWLLNPYTEFLVAKEYHNLIGDKNFNRLSKAGKKEILREIGNEPELKGYPLKYIQIRRKSGLNYDEIYDYFYYKLHCCPFLTLRDFRYITEKGIDITKYNDYINMLPTANKDKNDEYWRHPKDFDLMHERLVIMVERIRETERKIERKIGKRISTQDKAKAFWLYGKNFRTLSKNIDGYEIYIPSDISDLRLHAQELAQCLVSCSYDKKMAERKCLLVFIKKEGKSVATVELNKAFETVQFYADEHNRAECHPTEEVKEAFGKWKKGFLIWNKRVRERQRRA